MARSSYYTDPASKHLESYLSFPGGLNTMTAEDNLSEYELPGLVNKDLAMRGSVKRRGGMIQETAGQAGKGQGYFRFYKAGGGFDKIQAIAGKLYVNGVQKITGLQATRTMEAVQFNDKLYIATGSGLYAYDGTTLAKVVPYKPMPLEALYVGTNGLSDNPSEYLQDGVSTTVALMGVTFDKRYGVVNVATNGTIYVNKPVDAVVEYQVEMKMIAEPYDKWNIIKPFGTSKTFAVTTENAGEYELKVSARTQGQTVVESFYSVPKYIVKPTVDPADTSIPPETMDDCNRIILHWNRLIMYGDPTQPDVIYISHLNNPEYFPVPNSLRFTNPKREGLTSLVRFRDIIVAFTKTSIQALYGKSPADYQRVTLNTAVGCIAPYSAKVFGNYIGFLSYEGIHILKSLGFTEDKANVQVISENIQSEVHFDENAVAEVHGNQYHIVFPDRKKRLRYYHLQGIWAKDTSDKFGFSVLYTYDGDLLALDGTNGTVYEFSDSVFTDDGYVYEDYLETKAYLFGEPFKRKKIREIQLLTTPVTESTTVTLDFYVDNKLTATKDVALTVSTGVLPTINGMVSDKHELKLAGKGRAIKVVIKHNQANPFHLLGLGFIFKLKTP